MNVEYLLREVKKNKISITQQKLFDIPYFKNGKDAASMESLALILNGHQPIQKYSFDIKKFKTWCEENNLIFYLDEEKQVFHLKIK